MTRHISDFINEYHEVTHAQLLNVFHEIDGYGPLEISGELKLLNAAKKIHKKKRRAMLDDKAQTYYLSAANSLGTYYNISYGDILPNTSLKNDVCSSFGLYVNTGMVRNTPTLQAIHRIIYEDLDLTRELIKTAQLVKHLGAISFPQYIERSLISESGLTRDPLSSYASHKYELEEYFHVLEADAWSRFLDNKSVVLELSSPKLREYLIKKFPVLLFERPDLLRQGNVFDKQFVMSVDPTLRSIFDILALTDNFVEQIEMFKNWQTSATSYTPVSLPTNMTL